MHPPSAIKRSFKDHLEDLKKKKDFETSSAFRVFFMKIFFSVCMVSNLPNFGLQKKNYFFRFPIASNLVNNLYIKNGEDKRNCAL